MFLNITAQSIIYPSLPMYEAGPLTYIRTPLTASQRYPVTTERKTIWDSEQGQILVVGG